ncbi:MAG: hypothetical protein WAM90_18430 [Rhodanobacter sp.]
MKVIEDLIDQLSKADCRIEDALIQAQVLAHKLGDTDMAAWVASELEGYPDNDSVPPYREVRLQITGNVTNGYWQHNAQPLVLGALEPEVREWLTLRKTTEGVGAIEQWVVKDNDGGNLCVTVSPEICHVISKAYTEGCYVQSAWGRPAAGAFRQILTQVRTRLLAFALDLHDRVPANFTADDIKKELGKEGVNNLFRGAVFGDNTTIVVGESNVVKGITNSVTQNDFASLAKELRGQGVADGDIDDLRKAIEDDSDAPEHQENNYGGKVRGWLGGMVAKAGTEAWKTTAASGVGALYAALKAHYDWP